jgi:hypothetical protein
MGATLSGVAFYRAKGYAEVENQEVPLGNGEALPIVKMAKEVNGSSVTGGLRSGISPPKRR